MARNLFRGIHARYTNLATKTKDFFACAGPHHFLEEKKSLVLDRQTTNNHTQGRVGMYTFPNAQISVSSHMYQDAASTQPCDMKSPILDPSVCSPSSTSALYSSEGEERAESVFEECLYCGDGDNSEDDA